MRSFKMRIANLYFNRINHNKTDKKNSILLILNNKLTQYCVSMLINKERF